MKSIFFDAWVVFDSKTKSIKMDPRTGALCIFESEKCASREAIKIKGSNYKQVRWAKEYIFDKLLGATKELEGACCNLEYEAGRVDEAWKNVEDVIDEIECEIKS